MPVLVNFKICDNAPECSGIEVCPTGTLFWNAKEGKIGTDNDLCISCHECENACPVGAIHVADSDSDFVRLQSNIENDSRTAADLFVERYGAMPIDEELVLDDNAIERLVKKSSVVFVEQFKDSSIQCLLHSIPAECLAKKYDCIYRKQQVPEQAEGSYPRLLIYDNGTLKGLVEGYFEESRQEDLLNEINAIITNR